MGILFCLIALVLGLSGCSSDTTTAGSERRAVQLDATEAYTVYWEETFTPALYEPEDCYLGAYIMEDPLVKGDMTTFETLIDADQQMYGCKLQVGDAFPVLWVLENYVMGAVPKITLSGQRDEEKMTAFAKEAGKFDVPILLEFYPHPGRSGMTPEEYKAFYVRVRSIFAAHAPNVAFLWTADAASAPEELEYYPGDGSVDWVGVSLFLLSEESTFGGLDYLYYTFQEKKPVLVNLGVAHYTTDGYRYDTAFAEKTIVSAYQSLLRYPRVRAVVYQDYNSAEKAPKSALRHNFCITEEEKLMTAYRNAMATEPLPDDGFCRSAFAGYVVDGTVYISEKTLRYEMEQLCGGDVLYINGGLFYPLAGDVEVEESAKRIFILSGTSSENSSSKDV